MPWIGPEYGGSAWPAVMECKVQARVCGKPSCTKVAEKECGALASGGGEGNSRTRKCWGGPMTGPETQK